VATYGYLVFNIDYRLSCDPEVYTDVPICGFTFSVPPDDVKTAMHWARNHASDYVSGGNSLPLVGIGTSAGGNLVFEVGTVGIDGDTRPDVMAGVSGEPVVGYMSNGHAACTDAYIPEGEENVCWVHANAFLGTTLYNPAVDLCEDNWSAASPTCNVDSQDPPPPTFIANSTDELSALQGALDFKDALDAQSVTWELCTVSAQDGHLHGTELLNLNVDCDESTTSVFDHMMAFIAGNLP
jgi:acetyl esterase/lipase